MKKLQFPITEAEDTKPLLGMDWLREVNWTMRHIEKTTTITNQSKKDKKNTNFEKLFKMNRTIEDTEIKIQLKPGLPPIKQKARPIPHHFQGFDGKNINLIQSGHFEKVQKVDKDCFVSPTVTTVRKDKSVQIKVDSRKLSDSCMKMRPPMLNM